MAVVATIFSGSLHRIEKQICYQNMTCNGYYNSFQAMRMNYREEKFKEGKLRELQTQEDKTMGIWAKKQLRIEQQIPTEQSPLQRVRRIRNKRQEEINRIHSSIANGGTEHKTSEKRLSKRLNSCHSERELETSLEKNCLASPEDDTLSRTSSSSSLPIIPVEKHTVLTQSRSKSLPILFCNPTTPPFKNKMPLLPPMDQPPKTCHKSKQTLANQKPPPLKPNCWI